MLKKIWKKLAPSRHCAVVPLVCLTLPILGLQGSPVMAAEHERHGVVDRLQTPALAMSEETSAEGRVGMDPDGAV